MGGRKTLVLQLFRMVPGDLDLSELALSDEDEETARQFARSALTAKFNDRNVPMGRRPQRARVFNMDDETVVVEFVAVPPGHVVEMPRSSS
jgi:hypothetical protein